MLSNSVQIAARQWVDSLEKKWRLQIISKTYRLDKDGNRVERPTRIRRFVEGMPISCAKEALDYLISLAPYKGIIYNGVEIEGEYIPSRTTWQRDDQIVVNSTTRPKTDGTYTLVQDLVDRELWDRYGALSAINCTEETETDWVWDAPYIEDLPVTGSEQGVSWALQAVSRNEDGTFNYSIVKRTAKYTHTEKLLFKTTASETMHVEQWDNLYGEPSTGYKDENGTTVTVPTASSGDGSRVEIEVTKNADCTYRVRAVYYADVEDDLSNTGAASCSEETAYDYHWADDEVPSVSSSQGVTKSVQNVRRTDNGLYDYVIVTRTAITQDSGKLTVSDTDYEKVEKRTWDNAYGSVGAWVDNNGTSLQVPASASGSNLIVSVEHSENADCTFKVVATWTTRKSILQSSESTHTQYEGSHSETKDGAQIALGTAPDASGGVVKDFESLRQPDGSYKTVAKTKVERPVPESVKSIEVGRRGRRVTVVDTNQPSPADMSSVGIGGSVKSEKTPGKLYNNTTVTWDLSDPIRVAESCTEDILHHQHSGTTSGVSSIPSANEHVYGSGTNGLVIKRQTEMDDSGSISQTVTNDQEKTVVKYEEAWQVNLTGVTHKTTHRQVSQSDVDHLGTVPVYDRAKVGQTLRRVKTSGGLTDVEITEIDKTADPLKAGIGCSKTAFLHTDTGITHDPSGSMEESHVPTANNGLYYETESKLNPDGSSTHTTRTNQEIEERNAEVSYRRTSKGLVTTVRHRNVTDTIEAPDENHAGNSTAREMTNGRLYNVTSVVLSPNVKPDHFACAKTIYEHSHDNVTMGTGHVDQTEAVAAGGGVYHQRSSEMDSEGFVRTTDRTISELPVDEAERQYKSDRFSKFERVTKKNQLNPTIEIPDFLDDDDHTVVTVSAKKNPGGSIDVTTDKDQKKYRHWAHTVDDNWLYERTIWFKNATEEEKDALYDQEYSSFSTKFDGWKKDFLTEGSNCTTGEDELARWRSKGYYDKDHNIDADIRIPVSYSITPNVTQNENGLYDGTFRFSAKWDMDSAGQRGTLNAEYHSWFYNDRMIQVSPHVSSGSVSNITTVINRGVMCVVGRGKAGLNALLIQRGTCFSGTRMDYNPITHVWHVSIVYSCNIYVNGVGVS